MKTCLHPWLSKNGRPCEYCDFYVQLGLLVERTASLGALDAIARLLWLHARTRRAHNRELAEEQREAGRSASIAYAEGEAAGRETADWR